MVTTKVSQPTEKTYIDHSLFCTLPLRRVPKHITQSQSNRNKKVRKHESCDMGQKSGVHISNE